ncbi:hypothetical protein ACOME3_008379 [Neoechinorhynchus agilis]
MNPGSPSDTNIKSAISFKISKSRDSKTRHLKKAKIEDESIGEYKEDSHRCEYVRSVDRRGVQPVQKCNSKQAKIIPLLPNRTVNLEHLTDEIDYDQMDISEFGAACLRGMGQEVGIDKPVDKWAYLRPRGLGLGADKSLLEQLNSIDSFHYNNNLCMNSFKKSNHEEVPCLRLGACVQVLRGPEKGNHGIITEVNEDCCRIKAKMWRTDFKKLDADETNLSQYSIRVITRLEYAHRTGSAT